MKHENVARLISCPCCKKRLAYDGTSPFRPFCSERCKTADIAAWASETFTIAGEAVNRESIEGLDGEKSDDADRYQ